MVVFYILNKNRDSDMFLFTTRPNPVSNGWEVDLVPTTLVGLDLYLETYRE